MVFGVGFCKWKTKLNKKTIVESENVLFITAPNSVDSFGFGGSTFKVFNHFTNSNSNVFLDVCKFVSVGLNEKGTYIITLAMAKRRFLIFS